MRNIFDQYNQPENRITHALLTALDKDRGLLAQLLARIKLKPPCNVRKLQIHEQKVIGQPEESEIEYERKGLPDGWIHDGESWCLLIESKISSRLTVDQLRRHKKTAERCGFTEITVLAIEATPSNIHRPDWLRSLQWSDTYQLLTKAPQSDWAKVVAEYYVIAEQKFSDEGYLQEGNLTVFDGIPFDQDHPFNYLEAKRLLKLIMEELRSDKAFCRDAGINPEISGRGAITGSKGSGVWDYLSYKNATEGENFTNHPHFTIGISNQRLNASITIPNGINTAYRRSLKQIEYSDFYKVIGDITGNMLPLAKKDPGYSPWCHATQRRYSSQRSIPIQDAIVEFDLRTAIQTKNDKVKPQEQWLKSVYEAYQEKRSNYQIQFGASIYFSRSLKVKKKSMLNTIKQTFIACTPLISMLEGELS